MLKKELNPVLMTALVIGATVGSGIFVLPGSLADSAGPGSLIAFALVAIGAFALVYVFTELGVAKPVTNGVYEYPKLAFGEAIGGINGWAYWIFMWSGLTAVLIGLMGYLGQWWPILNTSGILKFVLGSVILWVFTWINIKGVKPGATWGLAFTILKVVGLIVFVLWGLFHIKMANFTPFMPKGGGSIIPTMALLFWSFVGIESAIVVGEEARTPEVIKKSSFNALFTIVVVYAFTLIVSFGVMPAAQLAQSDKPLADIAAIAMGPWGATFVAIIAVFSIIGVLNNTILLTGRTSFAMARDGLFMRSMGTTNKEGSPAQSLILGSILANILLITAIFKTTRGAFNFVLLLSTLFCLIPYVFTMVSAIILHAEKPDVFSFGGAGKWKKIVVALVLGLIFSIIGIWGSGPDSMVWALIFVVIVSPIIFAFIKVARAKNVKKEIGSK